MAIRHVINGGLIFCFDEPACSSSKRAHHQSACQKEGVVLAMSWVRRRETRRVTWHLTVTRDRPGRGTNNTVPQGEKIILSKTSLDACMKTEVAMVQKGLTLSLTSSDDSFPSTRRRATTRVAKTAYRRTIRMNGALSATLLVLRCHIVLRFLHATLAEYSGHQVQN